MNIDIILFKYVCWILNKEMSETISVFGVSNDIIESYVERDQVDGSFLTALQLNKQIVVYGSSKQGKTSLIKKHLDPDSTIMIQCTPAMQLTDVYASILRPSGVKLLTESSEQQTTSGEVGGSFRAKIAIPIILEAEAGTSGKGSSERAHAQEYRHVEYNLSLAQDISEILKIANFKKYVILDNFHYLQEEVQKSFAFDLRVFQETDIRFIILGIWRERNRLTQFNGDLQDRVVEVAVEPWAKNDFERVGLKGSKILNVDLTEIFPQLVESSFDSIGVFQELCKESCLAAKVMKTLSEIKKITKENLQTAIEKKLQDYSGRHLRCFETFANSGSKSRYGQVPLFIPFYFLRMLLTSDFDLITRGFKRKEIQEKIGEIHHRPDDLRASDMSNFLHNIIKYQLSREIIPPLFDYDRSINTLKIIDSTLYFFLRNCDKEQVLADLATPSDQLAESFSNVESSSDEQP